LNKFWLKNIEMDTLGTVFSALADPSRREIIHRLARGPARVSDIAAPFSMSLNAVSKHIKVLERAGLVRRTRQGRNYILNLEGQPLREVARWTHVYERFWNKHLDHLEGFFAARRKQK
jgi:DNA-binding transcriptional ArsR family regulator